MHGRMDIRNVMSSTLLKQSHAKLKPPRTWSQNRVTPMVVNFVLSNLEFVVTDNAIRHQSNCFGFGTCLHHVHLKSYLP